MIRFLKRRKLVDTATYKKKSDRLKWEESPSVLQYYDKESCTWRDVPTVIENVIVERKPLITTCNCSQYKKGQCICKLQKSILA